MTKERPEKIRRREKKNFNSKFFFLAKVPIFEKKLVKKVSKFYDSDEKIEKIPLFSFSY